MRKYYVGLNVPKLSIAIAVLEAYGKLISRTVIETSTEAVRDFFRNLGGEIHLTLKITYFSNTTSSSPPSS